MFDKLDRELKSLPANFVVGLVTSSDGYREANLHVLDFLVNRQGATGSYITINRPYTNLVEMLKEKKINPEKLHFIDCITKTLGGKLPKAKNCVFVSSPSHLVELGVALHNYVTSSEKEKRFLHIDSLSTLCVHNSTGDILKFIHYLTGKMRVFGLNGIMISLQEESDKELITELSQFCDKMIHLK